MGTEVHRNNVFGAAPAAPGSEPVTRLAKVAAFCIVIGAAGYFAVLYLLTGR